jgi:hypothetical protein
MPVSNLKPFSKLCYSATAALTATANSGKIDWPNDIVGGSFILDVGAGTGTSPTLDVALQVSPNPDAVTPTWYTFSRYVQHTTAASIQAKICSFRPQQVAALVFTVADTGGVLENNMPQTGALRVLLTVGGTNPSYALPVSVWFIGWRGGTDLA